MRLKVNGEPVHSQDFPAVYICIVAAVGPPALPSLICRLEFPLCIAAIKSKGRYPVHYTLTRGIIQYVYIV